MEILDLSSDESSQVSPIQDQISTSPAKTPSDTLEASEDVDLRLDGSAPPASALASSEVIPVERNVFYNQETLKYMRIIDKYKRLDVAEIELPRVDTLI